MNDVEKAWIRGFATALAEMHRLLVHGSNGSGVRDVARDACVTYDMIRQAGLTEYDLYELARAGIK